MESVNGTNSLEPQSAAFAPGSEIGAVREHSSLPQLTEWQRFFLTRLEHLLEMQQAGTAGDDAQRTLLSKAVYSTYLDCQTQGVGEAALQRITNRGSNAPSTN